MLPELPLTQEEALRFQEENLAAAVCIHILLIMMTMMMVMMMTPMIMFIMMVMMTMMVMVMMMMTIQVVGVSQSKRSSRVQSRVGSLAPSRSQKIINIIAKNKIINNRNTTQNKPLKPNKPTPRSTIRGY